MKIALVLHAHQPPTQSPEVSRKIAESCYISLFEILSTAKNTQVNLNVTRSWGESLLEAKQEVVIDMLKALCRDKKVSIMQTAAYHPLLTKIPAYEVQRQINLHQLFTKEYLDIDTSDAWVFLPEMSFNQELLEPLASAGVTKLLLDESAFPAAGLAEEGKHVSLNLGNHLYVDVRMQMQYLFRDRPLSLALAFGKIKTLDNFKEAITKHLPKEQYAVLALDAETFGHHHKDNLKLLKDLIDSEACELVSLDTISQTSLKTVKIEPLTSTWGAGEESEGMRQFPRWDNPNNPLHHLQWIMFRVAIKRCKHLSLSVDNYDKALNSDQFWWSSANPCWHPYMVEKSTNLLFQAIKEQGNLTSIEEEELISLKDKIITLGNQLYGGQVIEC